MSTQATMAMCLIALVAARELRADDELMCVAPPALSSDVTTLADAGDVVLDVTADAVRRALILQSLQREPLQTEPTKPGGAVRYSISENMTAAMRYDKAFVAETGRNDELRTNRFTAFSTARERDVLGLGMDWGVGEDNVVGFGYQLQSIRPDPRNNPAGGLSILPGSEGVDHSFTFGVTRSWGGTD